MAMNVVFDARSGAWVIRRAGTTGGGDRYPTQALAIGAASAQLAATGGGELRIQGEDGLIQQTKTIPAQRSATMSPGDVADAIQAGAARIAGDQTTDAGDDALEKVLLVGPDTASKRAVSAANRGLDWGLIVVGLLGPMWGIQLISPDLEGGVFAIFLSTLSISLGVFLAFMIIGSNRESFSGRSGTVEAVVVLAIALVASNVVAMWVGQPTTLDNDGTLMSDLQRVARYGMPADMKLAALAATVVASVLLGGVAVYGFVGMLLAVGCGLLVGWRAHDLTT